MHDRRRSSPLVSEFDFARRLRQGARDGRRPVPSFIVRRPPSLDVVLSSACGLAALALYIWTLQPGPGGPEDTPKFQCLGYALGTAHPPGSPLYTILTHLASY